MTIFQNTPHDITAVILEKCKVKSLIGDDVLDKFLIKYCTHNNEAMLYAFVKRGRLYYLMMYIVKHRNQVQWVSNHCVQTLFTTSIKYNNFNIATYLCKVFAHKMVVLHQYIIKHVISSYLKRLRTRGPECTECHNHLHFLEQFAVLCKEKSINLTNVIPRYTLVSILTHKDSHCLINTLLRLRCLHYVVHVLIEQHTNNHLLGVISAIISNNHNSLLALMIDEGYCVTVSDVVIGVAFANYETNKLLLKYFKPRWYSKRFVTVMLDIAWKREDKRILHDLKLRL